MLTGKRTNAILFRPTAVHKKSRTQYVASKIAVFVVDTNWQCLFRLWEDNGQEGPWTQLPHKYIISEPVVFISERVVRGQDTLIVFVLADDYQIHSTVRIGDQWSTWKPIGGPFSSKPVGVMMDDDRIFLVAVGRDCAVYSAFITHTLAARLTISPWESLGGCCVAVSVWRAGDRLYVFALSVDGGCLRKTYNGSWSDWSNLRGNFVSLSTTMGSNQIYMIAVGADSRCWQRTLPLDEQ